MTVDNATAMLHDELTALRQRVAELEQVAADARLKSGAFDTLTRHLPNAWVLMFDQDLRHTFIDGGPARDDASETVAGKTLQEFFPPETSEVLDPIYRAAFTGESSNFSIPFGDHTYDFSTMPVRADDETILAGMAIVVDTTALYDLRNQLKTFEMIVENAADSVMRYDMNEAIQYLNPAALKMYGMESVEDVIGKHASILAGGEVENLNTDVRAGLEQHGFWRGELPSQRMNGEQFLAQATVFVLTDQNGTPSGVASISRDITNAKQDRQEKLELQQQVIDAQQAALRELSTPLIPLAEGVVALPLVGTIDSNRALQVMETLLEGIATQQAEVALIDITGVRVIDTQVADALLRAAQAAKLLGAQVVLTGISSEIAQTLVQLGADMGSITTRATLQSGIAYALEQQVAY